MKSRGTALLAALTLTWASGPGCGGSSPPVAPTAIPSPTPPLQVSADGRTLCFGTGTGIEVIVSPAILDGIRAELTQFELDLCREGHGVRETSRAYSSAPQLRAH